MGGRDGPVDEQGLGGAADAGAPHLGIAAPAPSPFRDRRRDRHRHARSPSRWANTGTRASSCTRATRLLPPRGTITSRLPPRPFSISPTAARSRVGTREIAASGRPAARRPSTRHSWIEAGRQETVRAAAQDRGIAGLETKRAGVGRDIGPALVDHADDAERRRDALDLEAVRAFEGRENAADRIGQSGDLLEPLGHRLDALGIERQPVESGRVAPCAVASATSRSLAARISPAARAVLRGDRSARFLACGAASAD